MPCQCCAISGGRGLERCDGGLSPQNPRSQTRLTTSAQKARGVVSTAEPPATSDCSALSLDSARFIILSDAHVSLLEGKKTPKNGGP
jgi:hypothetical protein